MEGSLYVVGEYDDKYNVPRFTSSASEGVSEASGNAIVADRSGKRTIAIGARSFSLCRLCPRRSAGLSASVNDKLQRETNFEKIIQPIRRSDPVFWCSQRIG